MNDRNQQLVDGLKRLIEEIELGGQDVLYCEESVALSIFRDTPRDGTEGMVIATHLGMAERPMRKVVIYLMTTEEWFEQAKAEKRSLFDGPIELTGTGQLKQVEQETIDAVRAAEEEPIDRI